VIRPRRSVLYMPGANARALEKARDLPADALILDLEDAVAPEAKEAARERVVAAVAAGGYGGRELIVRINGLDTPWGQDDVRAVASLDLSGVLVPKVERVEQVAAVSAALGSRGMPLWIMVETPLGVLRLEEIVAGSPRIEVLVMGTSDLVQALHARHTAARAEVMPALARCVLVARAFDRVALDGVHLDFRDPVAFRAACTQARDLGFDGKTLIHPGQIEIANEVFAPSPEEVARARRVLEVWRQAEREGKGVAVLDGRLVENLHVAEAERVLGYAAVLDAAPPADVKATSPGAPPA
jgi:citrate lyase subunit beta/citryl-CoA lyase